MQTNRKSILAILATNASVFVAKHHPNQFDGDYDIRECKVASVLVSPNGKIEKPLILVQEGMRDTLTYARLSDVYASVEDIINRNPLVQDGINVEWLHKTYDTDRRLFYLNAKEQICFVSMGMYIQHINIVTGEVTFNQDMTQFFPTEEELKTSRPDIFPPTVKVKITKTYEVEVDKEEAKELVANPADYEVDFETETSTSAEIVD